MRFVLFRTDERWHPYVHYTWRVPTPRRNLTLTWHTCDLRWADSHSTTLLHAAETIVMHSHERSVIETYHVPADTTTISITALGTDGWYVVDLASAAPSPRSSSRAHGYGV